MGVWGGFFGQVRELSQFLVFLGPYRMKKLRKEVEQGRQKAVPCFLQIPCQGEISHVTECIRIKTGETLLFTSFCMRCFTGNIK